MEYTKIIDGNAAKVKIMGKCTFPDHVEFRKILDILNIDALKRIEIDINGATFIDSAALGILLLMRDEAKKKSIDLAILRPQGQVKRMFEISRFYDLFQIVDE